MEDGAEIKASLIIAIQTRDLKTLTSTLNSLKAPLESLKDSQNYTIFHDLSTCILSESDLLSFLSLLISHFPDPLPITQLLNLQTTPDLQTALHLAVKHNHQVLFIQKLVKEFIILGANPKIKDKNLHTVCHLAAMTGKVALLSFFKEQNLAIEEKDLYGRVPLHLAAMEGQTTAGLFLIANCEQFDVKDSEGMTPLHYAAMAANYRISRHLLLKGANKTVKDKLGRTPLDIAKEKGEESIVRVLNGVRNGICKKSFGRVEKSRTHLLGFVFSFCVRWSLVGLMMWSWMEVGLVVGSLGLFVGTGVAFVWVSFKDPGYVSADRGVDLYENYRPEYICPYCKTLQKPNVRHCHYCQRCISDFDHHCPWINNCVGSKNHKIFIIFLSFLCCDFLFHFILGVLYYNDLLNHRNSNHYFYNHNFGLFFALWCIIGLFIVFPLWFLQISNIVQNKTTNQRFSFDGLKRLNSDFLNTRLMMLPESDGWISQRNSTVYEEEPKELCCCFPTENSKRLSIGINGVSN